MEGLSNSTSIPRPKAPCENFAKEGRQFCSSAKLGQQLTRLSSNCHPMMSVAVARLHHVSEVACQTKSSAAVNRTWGILQQAFCSRRSLFLVLGVGRCWPRAGHGAAGEFFGGLSEGWRPGIQAQHFGESLVYFVLTANRPVCKSVCEARRARLKHANKAALRLEDALCQSSMID